MSRPERPTAVTVFGVLGILFGALGVLCSPLSLFSAFGLSESLMQMGGAVPGVMEQQMAIYAQPSVKVFLVAQSIIGLALSSALLIGGIGLLRLDKWGWTLSVAYGIGGLIWAPLAAILSYLLITVPMMQQMDMPASALGGGAFGALCGSAISFIYPILLLVFMFQPSIKAAFDSQSGSYTTPPPLNP